MGKVKCFYCGEIFDNATEEYRKPRANRYAHLYCYKENMTEDDKWVDKIYTLLEEIHLDYDYVTVENQRGRFVRNSYTNKGIYMTLKYFYEVKNGNKEKANKGIGIVPYVYEEARQHFLKKKNRKEEFGKMIEEQFKQEPRTIKVNRKINKKKKRKEINLGELL